MKRGQTGQLSLDGFFACKPKKTAHFDTVEVKKTEVSLGKSD